MASEEFFKSLLDNLSDGVYFVDRERRILYWNRGAEELTGFAAAEVVGRRCADGVLMHVDGEGCALCDDGTCPAAAVMRSGEPVERRVFLHHHDGHRVPVMTRIAPLRGPNGDITGAVEVFSDDSVALAAADQIAQLRQAALLDPLTGIGNRRYGEVELASRLGTLARYGWALGLLMVDVDRFKDVNDRHGHEAGDGVLRMVAQTLSRNVRPFDAVCRWGGEVICCTARSSSAAFWKTRPSCGLRRRSALPLPSALPLRAEMTRHGRWWRAQTPSCTRPRRPAATASAAT